jgi:hypothetical protein
MTLLVQSSLNYLRLLSCEIFTLWQFKHFAFAGLFLISKSLRNFLRRMRVHNLACQRNISQYDVSSHEWTSTFCVKLHQNLCNVVRNRSREKLIKKKNSQSFEMVSCCIEMNKYSVKVLWNFFTFWFKTCFYWENSTTCTWAWLCLAKIMNNFIIIFWASW